MSDCASQDEGDLVLPPYTGDKPTYANQLAAGRTSEARELRRLERNKAWAEEMADWDARRALAPTPDRLKLYAKYRAMSKLNAKIDAVKLKVVDAMVWLAEVLS